MATPRADTYSAASGAAVYAGMAASGGLPSWVTSMAARTWKKVPLGNTFMSIDPELRADMNPNYPGQAPWHGSGGHAAILNAWGPLVPSRDDAHLYTLPTGGHGDFAGSYMAGVDLMQEVPLWYLINRPSGALPGAAVTYNDGNEASGLYSDGRVRSGHGYQNFLHIPGTTKVMQIVNTAMYPAGNVTGPNKAWFHDVVTGAQSDAYDYSALTSVTPSNTGENSGFCYDSKRHSVWHVRGNGTTKLIQINLTTGAMTEHGTANSWVGGCSKLEYIPTHDVILNLTNISGGSGYTVFDPVANSWGSRIPPAITGSPSAGLSGGSNPAGFGGGGWIDELGGVVAWNNDSNTTEISLLTMTSPTSLAWSVVSVAAENTVVPPARVGGSGGLANIGGRFGHLKAIGCCYLLRSATDDLYVFKL